MSFPATHKKIDLEICILPAIAKLGKLTTKRGLRHKMTETPAPCDSRVVSPVESDYDWVRGRQIVPGPVQLGDNCEIPLDNRVSQA